jgi:hypothetical protein
MSQPSFIREIVVPRVSVGSSLAHWARQEGLQEWHMNDKVPFIFVATPRFDAEGDGSDYYGWIMYEWVFKPNANLLRYRVYQPLNPAYEPLRVVINEDYTPSQYDYLTFVQKDDFVRYMSKLEDHWVDQRDVRMKSRQTIPSRLSDASTGLIPEDSQVTDEAHKTSCLLLKSVFETMAFCPEADLEKFICMTDEELAPLYMPASSTITFTPKIEFPK